MNKTTNNTQEVKVATNNTTNNSKEEIIMNKEVKVITEFKEVQKVHKTTVEDMIHLIKEFNRYNPTTAQWVDLMKAKGVDFRKSLTSDVTYYIMREGQVYIALQFHDTLHQVTAFSRKMSVNNPIFDIVIGSNERRRKAEITPKQVLTLLGITA